MNEIKKAVCSDDCYIAEQAVFFWHKPLDKI